MELNSELIICDESEMDVERSSSSIDSYEDMLDAIVEIGVRSKQRVMPISRMIGRCNFEYEDAVRYIENKWFLFDIRKTIMDLLAKLKSNIRDDHNRERVKYRRRMYHHLASEFWSYYISKSGSRKDGHIQNCATEKSSERCHCQYLLLERPKEICLRIIDAIYRIE